MKLGTLIKDGFVKSLNDLNKKDLPGPIAWKVSKISTKAAEEQKDYFKVRSDLIKKYTKTNEDGSNKTVERDGREVLDFGEDLPLLEQELQDVGNQEVELPKIKLSDLLNAKPSITLSGAMLQDLSDLIEDDLG